MARRRRKSGSLDVFAGAVVFVLVAGGVLGNLVAEHMQVILLVVGAIVLLGLVGKWERNRRAASQADPVASAMPAGPPKRAGAPLRAASQNPPNPFGALGTASAPQAAPGVTIRALVEPQRFRESAKAGDAGVRWVAPGEPATVKDLRIAGGMFYLATRPMTRRDENWVVDPALPMAKIRSLKTDPPSYYPSYSGISPAQRRGFLEWMAGGRNDPAENLSLVFLFVYGLEYRLLGEGSTADAPQIIAETERLLAIYRKHQSFASYVGRFLAFARAHSAMASAPAIDMERVSSEMPLAARIYLGARLRDRRPLSADEALIWATASPLVWRRRWPAAESDVFRDLWRQRFNARWPAGLSVAPPTSKIAATYRAMSGRFEAGLKGAAAELPDVSTDAKTAHLLEELVSACWDELGRYRSHLQRKKAAAGVLAASLSLPVDLWIRRHARSVAAIVAHLGSETAKVLKVGRLLSIAELQAEGESPKTLAEALTRLAEGLWESGVGIEPDGRHRSGDLTLATVACVFRLPRASRKDTFRDEARTAVDVAVLCACGAENASVEAEAQARVRVAATVASSIDADDLETVRLRAYAGVLQIDPRHRGRLLKAAAGLSDDCKRAAALAAVAALAASGSPPAQSVRQLEALYKAVGLPADALYAELHRAATGVEQRSEAGIGAAAIAAIGNELNGGAARGGASAIDIDPERLERARRSTQAVAEVLSEVFVEDPEPKPIVGALAVAEPAGPFEGLDAAHGALLSDILAAGSIGRDALEARAAALKVLAEGALDAINEWAFDQFDEPVIEGADDISVAPHLVERLRAMRKQAYE